MPKATPTTPTTSAKVLSSGIANSRSELREKIINYVRAGYSGLYLISHEEQRVDAEMVKVAEEIKHSLFFWSCVDGLIDHGKGLQVKAGKDMRAEVLKLPPTPAK